MAKTRTKKKSTNRYVPALDGLRALAVLSVIAYHMRFTWASGGLLGVTMFFVLSGYLITGLLLREHEQTGTISLKGFWLRRVRRIIPAVLFAVLGTALLCTIFDHALLTKMRPDVLPTLLFFNNWWQIFHNVSYFAAIGEPSPLTHYWSLSIEEQFYLVWPVLLLLCLRMGVKRGNLEKGIAIGAALSALLMLLLFNPAADPSRVYYGTDTRAFSLLIGALLAFLWPHQKLGEQAGKRMTSQGRLILDGVGIAATLGLIIMVIVTNGFSPFVYRGGLLLCSLLTAIAIAVMVHPASLLGRFFALKPLVWIGKLSYSMYLWHYPIILLMTPNNQVGDVPIWLRLLQLVVIIGISAFSYYLVENPLRHGALGRFIKSVRSGKVAPIAWAKSHIPTVAVSAVVILGALGGLAFVPNTSSLGDASALEAQQQALEAAGLASNSAASAEASDASSESEASEDASTAAATENAYNILLIGDSVSVRTIPYFEETFPNGHIDALINRQMYEAPEIYAWYRDEGLVGDVVVLALGTNGYVYDDQIDALMDEIGSEKHVWFIDTRSPEEYMPVSNDSIWSAADRYDNVSIISWYDYSDGHPEYFDGDGTHLTDDAAQIYTQMIYDAVSGYLSE